MLPTADKKKKKDLKIWFFSRNHHKVYELPFQIKNDIAITMFQYNIINNILTTQVGLLRAKICGNNACGQCLTDIHSLQYMF